MRHITLPWWLSSKESAGNAGDTKDMVSIPGWGRSPGGRHGNPLQYSCVENPHGQRNLEGCSPWGCKESDTTEHTEHTQCMCTFYLHNFTINIYLREDMYIDVHWSNVCHSDLTI